MAKLGYIMKGIIFQKDVNKFSPQPDFISLKKACWIVSSLNDELPGEARGAEDDEVVPSRHRGRLMLGI